MRGPNGANDEFIELYNNSGADHTVAGGGTGYAVAASNGVARCVVPNGTVIPNRGHYLCVNSVGYSLASYPAGNGTTATGDATYTTDIPDNAGIAIFNTSVGGQLHARQPARRGRLDERSQHALQGRHGLPGADALLDRLLLLPRQLRQVAARSRRSAPCPISTPKDTNNNAADFVFVDTNGTSARAPASASARRGRRTFRAPSSATPRSPSIRSTRASAVASPPNRVRDFTSDPANNSTFGTLDIRRTVTNNTGGNVTRLRWRIIDITTFPAPSGIADLRPRTSTAVVVTVDRAPCGSGTSATSPCRGRRWSSRPASPTAAASTAVSPSGTVTLATPLANGATLDVRFLLGIQQTGTFKFFINVEALP